MTWLASGADSRRHFSTIAATSGSVATPAEEPNGLTWFAGETGFAGSIGVEFQGPWNWFTMWFVADFATMSFEWWSIVRSMLVTSRPKDAELVSSTSVPPKLGQMYCW